ncbi:unnamed protein product [Alternaria alternata]
MDVNVLGSHASRLVARAGGLHPPPEVLLSWPKPNYVDPEERGWGTPIVLMVFLGISFLVYCARMWARLAISKNTGLDDILVSIAILPLFGLTISTVLGIRIYGFQWHVWDQTRETLVTTREIAMAIELNYMLSTTLVKVSILCFYRRIGDRLTNQFIYWVYVTYDITWTAYSGWVWTTLEAQLAVICASVPSLKVFFIRYFGTDTTRAGYSQTGTPSKSFGPSSKPRSVGFGAKISQHSAQRSQCTAGSIRDDVPLDGIHINHKLDVKVEERDDCSQVSFASTKALTALPMPTQPGWRGRADWVDGCRTVCAALRPGSRGTSGSRSRTREGDVEAGSAF